MLYFTIALILLIFYILLPYAKKLNNGNSVIAYHARAFLLNNTERAFYKALKQALRYDYIIQAKVRISVLTEPRLLPDYTNTEEGKDAFVRIEQKRLDFLVLDKKFNLLLVIELIDSNKPAGKRHNRDSLVKAVCNALNTPLLFISSHYPYDTDKLRKDVQNIITT